VLAVREQAENRELGRRESGRLPLCGCHRGTATL
jgi:hypothetical protein